MKHHHSAQKREKIEAKQELGKTRRLLNKWKGLICISTGLFGLWDTIPLLSIDRNQELYLCGNFTLVSLSTVFLIRLSQ